MPAADLLRVIKGSPRARRYRMVLSYDGLDFHGWQKQHPPGQDPLRTVEGELEKRLRELCRQRLKLWPSGRTDAGVSAVAQVCSFDAMLPPSWDGNDKNNHALRLADGRILSPPQLAAAFNEVLPPSIRIRTVDAAGPKFSAMQSLWKRYRYSLPTDPDELNSLLQSVRQHSDNRPLMASELEASLDLAAMNEAATMMEGKHDFGAFQGTGGRKNTVRTVHRCAVSLPVAPMSVGGGTTPNGDRGTSLSFVMEGEGFLYKQVRIMSGTLLLVGLQLAKPTRVLEALQSPYCRQLAGPTLPARYLALEHVEYCPVHLAV